jgi:hypothetical protein
MSLKLFPFFTIFLTQDLKILFETEIKAEKTAFYVNYEVKIFFSFLHSSEDSNNKRSPL